MDLGSGTFTKMLPKRHRVDWSMDEEKLLQDNFSSGMNLSELADLHQRTIIALVNKLYKLGYTLNQRNLWWTEARIKFLIHNYASGMLLKEIAHQLSTTKGAVVGKLWRLGLSGQRTRKPEITDPTTPRKFSWEL